VIETPNNHFIFNFTLWCNFAGERKIKVVPSCLSFPLRWMNNLFLFPSQTLSLSLSLSQLKWVFMLFYFSPPNLPFQWAKFFKKKFPFSNLFLFWMCGNKSFMQPMRRFSMHSPGVQFFSLWGGECQGAIFCFFFSLVLNVFSSCSHGVPQVVPNSTIILSHMVCPKFNSYVYKVKRWAYRGTHFFLFWDWGSKEVLLWGSAQCFEKIGDGAINVFSFKKKKIVSAPMNQLIWIKLIMSHNGLPFASNHPFLYFIFTLNHPLFF